MASFLFLKNQNGRGEFKMVEKLTSLYNTLSLIETKGKNTIIMADCMKFLEQTIAEEKNKPAEPVEEE